MARIIERCPVSRDAIDSAISLIDEIVGAPAWGVLWLRHLVELGVEGEVQVDVSNVLALVLQQATTPPTGLTEDQLVPLRWWSWLTGGTVIADGDYARLILEGYPPTDTTIVGNAEQTLTECFSAVAEFGFRLPLAVAIALSAGGDASAIKWRRTTGRRGELMVVELCAATQGTELSAVFNQLQSSAGTRVAFARSWSDPMGWHYLEAFNELAPSENYTPPVVSSE